MASFSSIGSSIGIELFLIPVLVVFLLAYIVVVVRLIRKTRPNMFSDAFANIFSTNSTSMPRERLYQTILKGLEAGLITDIEDLKNLYMDYSGMSPLDDDFKYYLVRRLRNFSAFLIKQKDIDETKKNNFIKYNELVKQWVKDIEKKEPYSDIPTAERHILQEIERLLPEEKVVAISGRLKDLAGLIRSRNEEKESLLKTTRWSVPLTIIGLILTLIFGSLTIYQFFSENKKTQPLSTMSQTTHDDSLTTKVVTTQPITPVK